VHQFFNEALALRIDRGLLIVNNTLDYFLFAQQRLHFGQSPLRIIEIMRQLNGWLLILVIDVLFAQIIRLVCKLQ